jgi:hypothetical protein
MKKNKKTKFILVRFSEEDYKMVQEEAEGSDSSMGAVIRSCVKQRLEPDPKYQTKK